MSASRTTIDLGRDPTQLVVTASGPFAEQDGLALGASVIERLEADRSISRVLIDLRGLTSCEILARAALGELQRALKSRRVRTAYLTGTPRFRGMTLIVIQSAIDENAGTFVTEEQAHAWLRGDELRASLQERRIRGAR